MGGHIFIDFTVSWIESWLINIIFTPKASILYSDFTKNVWNGEGQWLTEMWLKYNDENERESGSLMIRWLWWASSPSLLVTLTSKAMSSSPAEITGIPLSLERHEPYHYQSTTLTTAILSRGGWLAEIGGHAYCNDCNGKVSNTWKLFVWYLSIYSNPVFTKSMSSYIFTHQPPLHYRVHVTEYIISWM